MPWKSRRLTPIERDNDRLRVELIQLRRKLTTKEGYAAIVSGALKWLHPHHARHTHREQTAPTDCRDHVDDRRQKPTICPLELMLWAMV